MFSAIRTVAPARAITRSFSTSRPASDLAKVTLIGRLGSDPILKHTASNKPYYIYALATTGPSQRQDDGSYIEGQTSWHNVFAFNESGHPALARLGKGSTVYVEADLEMKKQDDIEGQRVHDRILLRQNLIRAINRVKPSEEGTAE